MNPADTIVAISSPAGPAARGIVRLSGPLAFPAVAAIVSPLGSPEAASQARLQAETVRRALRERMGGVWDNVALAVADWPEIPAMIVAFAGPKSATGDDVAECHVVGAGPILEALTAQFLAFVDPDRGGIRAAGPGEFTLRAFLNNRLDITQAEAVGDLIAAPDAEMAAQGVANLTAGPTHRANRLTLAAKATAWREQLAQLLVRAEVALDFSEEEDLIAVADPPRLAAEIEALNDEISAVVAGLPKSRAEAVDRPNIVLGGPANAGKSSLFNALTGGGKKAIVTRRPGTTRDAISADMRNVPVRLWDTAGLRDIPTTPSAPPRGRSTDAESGAELDRQAELVSRDLAGRADLLVWCWPADVAPVQPPPDEIRGRAPWVLNQTKRDLPTAWSLDLAATRWQVRGVATSVKSPPTTTAPTTATALSEADGLGELRQMIHEFLAAPHGESARRGIFANARQIGHLRAAAACLQRAVSLAADAMTLELASLELADADRELAALLGVEPGSGARSDELLRRIFGQFCTGK